MFFAPMGLSVVAVKLKANENFTWLPCCFTHNKRKLPKQRLHIFLKIYCHASFWESILSCTSVDPTPEACVSTLVALLIVEN
jgi:hypothetical protein